MLNLLRELRDELDENIPTVIISDDDIVGAYDDNIINIAIRIQDMLKAGFKLEGSTVEWITVEDGTVYANVDTHDEADCSCTGYGVTDYSLQLDTRIVMQWCEDYRKEAL